MLHEFGIPRREMAPPGPDGFNGSPLVGWNRRREPKPALENYTPVILNLAACLPTICSSAVPESTI